MPRHWRLRTLQPNFFATVDIAPSGLIDKQIAKIPETLVKKNLFIQISSTSKQVNLNYFAAKIKAQIFQQYGQVKVTDENLRPLSKVSIYFSS